MVEKSQSKLKPVLTSKAGNQWRKILDFYARRNMSPDYSLKLDIELFRVLSLLCEQPKMGQETKRKNTRRHVVENYALFYRVNGENLEVTAIVDARQDDKVE